MSKIKIRETVKDIKAIDKSAVASQSMKKAFVRSKEKAFELLDDRQTTENEYAADHAQGMIADAAHGVAHHANSGANTAMYRGREQFREQRAKEAIEQRAEKKPNTPPSKECPPQAGGLPARISRQSSCPSERASSTLRRRPQQIKAPTRMVKQTAKSTGKAAAKTTKGTVKTAQRTAKTAQQTSRAAIKTAQATAKTTQQAAQTTAKAARATAQAARTAAKAVATAAKVAAKAVTAAVKSIIAAGKALVTAIAAGGWAAVIVIVVICMVGLIAGSCYGIFFVDEDTGSELTLQSVMQEIDAEYQSRIDEIIATVPHDTVEIMGEPAPWNEVLAVYAVKITTNPDNPQEVVTIDGEKAEQLREIYWTMTELSYVIILRAENSNSGTSGTTQLSVLIITATRKGVEDAADVYGFSEHQLQQLLSILHTMTE